MFFMEMYKCTETEAKEAIEYVQYFIQDAKEENGTKNLED